MRAILLGTTILAMSLGGERALAQTGSASEGTATERAEDAFGERIGLDRVGLYSEAQVRGFDLQGNGAYRIEGAYFSRAAGLSDAVAAGATVQVGVAATRQAQPYPSGVINYQLRNPDTPVSEVTVGIRDLGSWQVEAVGSWQAEDGGASGLLYGLAIPQLNTWVGGEGHAYDLGGVVRWSPSEATRLRAFAAVGLYERTGDIQVRDAGDALPPPLSRLKDYGPSWGLYEGLEYNAGVLLEHRRGPWRLDGSLFRSGRDTERSDYGLLTIDGSGGVTRTSLRGGPSEAVSDSVELRLTRLILGERLRQQLGVSVRGRRSETELPEQRPVHVDRFSVRSDPPELPNPAPAGGPVGVDHVEQATLSASYAAQLDDRWDLRAGVHRTRYDKSVRTGGSVRDGVDDAWLYNMSLTWRPTERLSFFGSYVTGLEETGTAPISAANRGEVLPPVRAKQYEFGAGYRLNERLNLIGAVFDIEKPINGFRPDGVFGGIGDVRHRGVEGSLTGRVGEDTSIVVGAVWNGPSLSGESVDAGLVNDTPPGVSEFTASVSVEHRLSFAPAWSVDAFYLYEGGRRVNARSDLRAPQVPFTSVGARWRFEVGGRAAQLRLQVLNALDRRGYYATPYEVLYPIGPRTVRALLTIPLR